jgi:hypothetical protein
MTNKKSKILEDEKLKEIIKDIVQKKLDNKPINFSETLKAIAKIFRQHGVKKIEVSLVGELNNIFLNLFFNDGSNEILSLSGDSIYEVQLVEFISDALSSMDPSHGVTIFKTKIEGIDIELYPP